MSKRCWRPRASAMDSCGSMTFDMRLWSGTAGSRWFPKRNSEGERPNRSHVERHIFARDIRRVDLSVRVIDVNEPQVGTSTAHELAGAPHHRMRDLLDIAIHFSRRGERTIEK